MKLIISCLVLLSLLFNGCKKDDAGDTSYIKTNKVYQTNDTKLYADISYSGIKCAENPEIGICWSYNPTPTINDNKVISVTECYTGGGGNLIIPGVGNQKDIYVRAYGLTPDGPVYGNEIKFKTR